MNDILRAGDGEPLFLVGDSENPDYPIKLLPTATEVHLTKVEALRLADLLRKWAERE